MKIVHCVVRLASVCASVLTLFQTIFALCPATVISGEVPDVFWGENSYSGSSSSLLNDIFENPGNYRNNEVNANASKSQSCFPLQNERF